MKVESNKEEIAPPGAVFRHYKGKEYKIIVVGRHSEDLELYVVYQGLYCCDSFGELPIWIRPLKMFFEEVEVDGKRRPRFERIE